MALRGGFFIYLDGAYFAKMFSIVFRQKYPVGVMPGPGRETPHQSVRREREQEKNGQKAIFFVSER